MNGGVESARRPPLLSAWHSHEGGTHLPSGKLTNETQEQKEAGPHGGPLPDSGGYKMQHLRDGKWTLPFPSLAPATPRGGDGPHAHPSLCPSPQGSPRPHRCLPASSSPGLSACRFLRVSVAISLSVSLSLLSRLPTHRLVLSSAGYPAGPRSRCPPVPLLLSVCPRPAADTAFNSLCPSPCNFSGLGEGDKEVMGWGSL